MPKRRSGLRLVTASEQAIHSARAAAPGLHGFLYDDAAEFVGDPDIAGSVTVRQSGQRLLDAMAKGFLHGEQIGMTDRREDSEILADLPRDASEGVVWDALMRIFGGIPDPICSLAPAMAYVAGLDDGPMSVTEAAYVACSVVAGFCAGRFRAAEGLPPITPADTVTLVAVASRLRDAAGRAASEACESLVDDIRSLRAVSPDLGEAVASAVREEAEDFAALYLISPIHESSLRCDPSLVVGRIRSFAHHLAIGIRDGARRRPHAAGIAEAAFGTGRLASATLGDDTLRDAVRAIEPAMCHSRLPREAMPIAVAYAGALAERYGTPGAGPVDWEVAVGTGQREPADAEARIAISGVAYAVGLRRGLSMEDGSAAGDRDGTGDWERKSALGASWDVDEDDGLGLWASVGSLREPAGDKGDPSAMPAAKAVGDGWDGARARRPHPGSGLGLRLV